MRRAAGGALRYVMLVGDAPQLGRDKQSARGEARVAGPSLTVPTHYLPSQVIHRFGGEPIIAGDNGFADLDDDRLPDMAIGRLPADSVDDLRVMVSKIVAYERGPAPGAWQRRINLVAGLGGFGALADAAIEASAKRLLIAGIPAAFATTVTYGSLAQPPMPDVEFHAATVERLDEGCLFWVYMGHGRTRAVDRVAHTTGTTTFSTQMIRLPALCGERSPIALLLCAAPVASISPRTAWPKSCCVPSKGRSPRWRARA